DAEVKKRPAVAHAAASKRPSGTETFYDLSMPKSFVFDKYRQEDPEGARGEEQPETGFERGQGAWFRFPGEPKEFTTDVQPTANDRVVGNFSGGRSYIIQDFFHEDLAYVQASPGRGPRAPRGSVTYFEGAWGKENIVVKRKKDRANSVNHTGFLIYIAVNGKQRFAVPVLRGGMEETRVKVATGIAKKLCSNKIKDLDAMKAFGAKEVEKLHKSVE
ncbi:unnamed protein product, partial [Prorocentrum cordatum]